MLAAAEVIVINGKQQPRARNFKSTHNSGRSTGHAPHSPLFRPLDVSAFWHFSNSHVSGVSLLGRHLEIYEEAFSASAKFLL